MQNRLYLPIAFLGLNSSSADQAHKKIPAFVAPTVQENFPTGRTRYPTIEGMRLANSRRNLELTDLSWWHEKSEDLFTPANRQSNDKEAFDAVRSYHELLSCPAFMLAKTLNSIHNKETLFHVFTNTDSFDAQTRALAFQKLYPKQDVIPATLSQRAIALKVLNPKQFEQLSLQEHGLDIRSLRSRSGKHLHALLKKSVHDYTFTNNAFGKPFFDSPLHHALETFLQDQFPKKKVAVVTEPIWRSANERGLGLHLDTADALTSLEEIAQTGSARFLDFTQPYPISNSNDQSFIRAINNADKSHITLYNAWFLIKAHPNNKYSLAFAPKIQDATLHSVNAKTAEPLFVSEGHTFDLLFPDHKLLHLVSAENQPGEYALIFETQAMLHGAIDRDFNNLSLIYKTLNATEPRFKEVKHDLWRESMDVRFAVWQE